MPTSMIEGADAYISEAEKAFSENLSYAREKREMTYLELAVRAGMTVRNANLIVRGVQGAHLRTIAALARALRVPVGDLFMDPVKFKERHKRLKPLPPLSDAAEASGSRKSTSVTEVSPFCKPQVPNRGSNAKSPERAA